MKYISEFKAISEKRIQKGKALKNNSEELLKIITKALKKKILAPKLEISSNTDYFEKVYHPFREDALIFLKSGYMGLSAQEIKEERIKIIHLIDFHFLPEFTKKLVSFYSSLILDYDLSSKIDKELIKKAAQSELYNKIAKATSKWILNFETIRDLIHRINLYHLLDGLNNNFINEKEINTKKWEPSKQIPVSKLIRKYSSMIGTTFSSTIFGYLKPVFFALGLTSLFPLAFPSSFGVAILSPISGLISLPTGIGSTCIGMFSDTIINKIAESEKAYISKQEVISILKGFKEINQKLKSLIRDINNLIIEMIQIEEIPEEHKKKLYFKMNSLLNPQSNVNPSMSIKIPKTKNSNSATSLKYIKEKNVDDEWVLLSNIDLEQKEFSNPKKIDKQSNK